jgi:hypothetical protein
MAIMRPVLENGAVYLDPYRGQVSVTNQVQRRAPKSGNNINETGWES